eukprot:COSAG04_NODE_534_length_12949_cov_5.651673_3_plen_232_part_00
MGFLLRTARRDPSRAAARGRRGDRHCLRMRHTRNRPLRPGRALEPARRVIRRRRNRGPGNDCALGPCPGQVFVCRQGWRRWWWGWGDAWLDFSDLGIGGRGAPRKAYETIRILRFCSVHSAWNSRRGHVVATFGHFLATFWPLFGILSLSKASDGWLCAVWISGARSATNPDAAAAAEGGLAGGLAVMAAGALAPQNEPQLACTTICTAYFGHKTRKLRTCQICHEETKTL